MGHTMVNLPSGKNSVVRPETVNVAIFEVERHDTFALSILHNQIKSEIFDEVVSVVVEGLHQGNNMSKQIK